ncbi:hypothetical protein ACHAWF_010361 [Thalassiosira exigua]
MASALSEWTSKPVTVLTCDGRIISGTLAGFDQLQNLVLKRCREEVYSPDGPMERVELGLFVVRGDNVAVIADRGGGSDGEGDGGEGGGDEEKGLEDVRAEPIDPIAGNR